MVKQAGGSLLTEDFLEHSDMPQFHWILSSTPDDAEGVAALSSLEINAAPLPETIASTETEVCTLLKTRLRPSPRQLRLVFSPAFELSRRYATRIPLLILPALKDWLQSAAASAGKSGDFR
jgi:hypothetical protein